MVTTGDFLTVQNLVVFLTSYRRLWIIDVFELFFLLWGSWWGKANGANSNNYHCSHLKKKYFYKVTITT